MPRLTEHQLRALLRRLDIPDPDCGCPQIPDRCEHFQACDHELTLQQWAALCCRFSLLVLARRRRTDPDADLEDADDYLDRPLPADSLCDLTQEQRLAVLADRKKRGEELFRPEERPSWMQALREVG